MPSSIGSVILAIGVMLCSMLPATAAEQVGSAVLIKTSVTGERGPIVVNGAVHRDERIATSQSGLGQFVFRDGTKLAVGWGSSVTIDKYVFDDSNSVQKLTISAAKGTFRWISGKSKSSAYSILTPAGTIGVRGTAFDVDVRPDGTTAVVLLSGAASFCGPGGCRQLTRRCDCVIAKPNGAMTNPQRVNRSVLRTLGSQKSLSFLSGSQELSGGMASAGIGCSLASATPSSPSDNRPQRSIAPQAPTPAPAPPAPAPRAEAPAPSVAPAAPPAPNVPDPAQTPNDPGVPDPDKPDKPDKHHHHHGHYGKGHHDRHDGDHWGRHRGDRRGGDDRDGQRRGSRDSNR